jgi:hypothetical protein
MCAVIYESLRSGGVGGVCFALKHQIVTKMFKNNPKTLYKIREK